MGCKGNYFKSFWMSRNDIFRLPADGACHPQMDFYLAIKWNYSAQKYRKFIMPNRIGRSFSSSTTDSRKWAEINLLEYRPSMNGYLR